MFLASTATIVVVAGIVRTITKYFLIVHALLQKSTNPLLLVITVYFNECPPWIELCVTNGKRPLGLKSTASTTRHTSLQ